MSTGAEHYSRAEELLALVPGIWERTADIGHVQAVTAEAQAHATLALAAATALHSEDLTEDFVAWEKTAGEYTVRRARETDPFEASAEDDARAERRSHEHCPGCPACTGYADPDEPDDDEDDGYSDEQLDGTACAVCNCQFLDSGNDRSVPTGQVIDGGQLFAHIDCAAEEGSL